MATKVYKNEKKMGGNKGLQGFFKVGKKIWILKMDKVTDFLQCELIIFNILSSESANSGALMYLIKVERFLNNTNVIKLCD